MLRSKIIEKYKAPRGFTIGGSEVINDKESVEVLVAEESSEDEVDQFNRILKKKPPLKKVRAFYANKVESLNEITDNNTTCMSVFNKKTR